MWITWTLVLRINSNLNCWEQTALRILDVFMQPETFSLNMGIYLYIVTYIQNYRKGKFKE